MREIGEKELEDITVGATILGTGGGGDPYIGKLMAQQAVKKHGPVTLLDPEEVDDDALVVSSAMMGAPSVMVEKIPNGKESARIFKFLEKYLQKEIYATMPIEAGGLNSLIPFALAAENRLPIVDVDGMGRAFPELQMVTFHLDGISATPMCYGDEKGNVNLIETINNHWTERIARAATIQMGGAVVMAIYSLTGKQLKESGIKNIITYSESLGKIVRRARIDKTNPIDELKQFTKGIELFHGKVKDINRKIDKGFTKGTAVLEGIDEFRGRELTLFFQNEHLLARSQNDVLCVTPDLICVLDAETAFPITTESLKYGNRCRILGIPCNSKWRTPKGIETCGPEYFGYDVPYTPVEELAKQRSTHEKI